MARLKSIAIGPGIGSAGDATYRTTRGRVIMSARVRTNSSNTIQQQVQRTIFGDLSQSLSKDIAWPRLLFAKSEYGSRRNNFVKSNFPIITNPSYPANIENLDPAYPMFQNVAEGFMKELDNADFTGFYLSKGTGGFLYRQVVENDDNETISEMVCSRSAFKAQNNVITLVAGSYNALVRGLDHFATAVLQVEFRTEAEVMAVPILATQAKPESWVTLLQSGRTLAYIGADKLVHVCFGSEALNNLNTGDVAQLIASFESAAEAPGGDMPDMIPYEAWRNPVDNNGAGFISALINGEPITFRHDKTTVE